MMADPVNIPFKPNKLQIHVDKSLDLPNSPTRSSSASPFGSPGGQYFQIPSPIITRRTRTFSASERALSNPEQRGKIKCFSRQKGHGFITPSQTDAQDIFFHISDIDGEVVPREGDSVTYRTCLIPPKNEKVQATHVVITNMVPGSHERWDGPPFTASSPPEQHNLPPNS